MTTARSPWIAASLSLATALFAHRADAQDAAALAARRALVEQAQAARNANDHARALDLAERASRISMTTSLRLLIAQEQNALGRLGDALGNAEQCSVEADRDRALRNRETILATCRALAADLRPRVAMLVVRPPSPAPAGLRITIAGHDLPDALWGVPYPVTPGVVTVEASAPGYASFSRQVQLPPGRPSELPIALAPSTAASTTTTTTATTVATTTPATTGGGSIVGPIVLMGVGGAALITSGVFLGLQRMELGNCPQDECPDQATIDRAITNTIVMYTTAAIGAAALGAGIIWLAVGSRGNAAPRTATRFHFVPLPGGAHAGLTVSF